MDTSSLGGSGLNIMIKGDDLDKLKDISNDIASMVSKIEGTTNVNGGLGITSREERIVINKNKASKYGLTVAQVFQKVSSELKTDKIYPNTKRETSKQGMCIFAHPFFV